MFLFKNMPQRNRGCQECRKRRVGCDRTLPVCPQCLLTNRVCSGAVQGALIVEQTRKVTSRYRQDPLCSRNRDITVNQQPSPRALLSMAFVSAFISNVTSLTDAPSRPGWLCQLRDIPQDERGSALDLALEAVAFAYCGVESKNHAVVMESYRMYGEALSRQSRGTSRQSEAPSPTLIYTSVILSLFEAEWSTSIAAYAVHLTAARKMLDSAGWEQSQNELLRQVVMHVQYQTGRILRATTISRC